MDAARDSFSVEFAWHGYDQDMLSVLGCAVDKEHWPLDKSSICLLALLIA